MTVAAAFVVLLAYWALVVLLVCRGRGKVRRTRNEVGINALAASMNAQMAGMLAGFAAIGPAAARAAGVFGEAFGRPLDG